MSLHDINNRNDITLLVDTFYKKVIQDDLIGVFFTEVIQLNWEDHIPIMIDFWESILLGTNKYKGNPISPHISLNKQKAIHEEHFKRWLGLWEENLIENFNGPNADEAIRRAHFMAPLIQFKIEQSDKEGFIQ